MKKLFIIIFILLLSLSVYASVDTVSSVQDPAKVAGVENASIAKIAGQTFTQSSSPCPPFYADANVVWSWDGQHTSGHNFGCFSNGTADEADSDVATTGTSYGEGGDDVGLLIADGSDYLAWYGLSSIIDQDGPQTICVKAKVSATLSGVVVQLARLINSGDSMRLTADGDDIVGGYLVTSGTDQYTGQPNLYTAGGWQTYAYSWQDVGSSGDHWADADTNTDEDAGELSDTQTNTISNMNIGNNGGDAPDSSKEVWITKFAIVNEYQKDCSTLTGW